MPPKGAVKPPPPPSPPLNRHLREENRKMREALETCKQVFDWYREIRGSDGALKIAVDAVNAALGGE